MADVFLSYQNEDLAWLQTVDARLTAEGFSTWWDHRVRAGEDWDDEIRDELEGARCVVVLWSERSWHSRWVQAEAHDAFGRGALVPARLDDVRLRVPFNKTQAEDLRPLDGLDRLVAAVRAHLSGESVPPNLAAPPVRHQMVVIGAAEDRSRVKREVAYLRSQGFAVHDASEHPGDEVLPEVTQQKLSSADEVLVLWSAAARRGDPGVRAQLAYARQVRAGRADRGEAFIQATTLDDTDLPAELSTKPGRVGVTVWLSVAGVLAAGAWVVHEGRATGWTWALLGAALALSLGVALLQWTRRGDRLLRAGRVFAAGQWLDRARAVELIAASEAILDRIFGRRVLSFRAFFVSGLISTLSVAVPIVLTWTGYGAAGGTGFSAASGALVGAAIGVPLAIGNVLFDFVSLLATRTALKAIVAKPSALRLWFGLALDTAVATACAIAALFTNLAGAAVFTVATAMDGSTVLDWTGWPRMFLGTTFVALTGGLRLENAFLDPMVGPVLVTAIATITSMFPSLLHGTLLAVSIGNRLLGHLPLRGLGDLLQRTADSPRGPWTVVLPLAVAVLAAGGVVAAEEPHRTVDQLVGGQWRPIDTARCGDPCLLGDPPEPIAESPAPFELLQAEVWQELWAAVWDEGTRVDADHFGLSRHPSTFEGPELPVESVSWCDAARFANLWSLVDDLVPFYGRPEAPALPDCETNGAERRADGTGYRLPTEEEWEVAARGGTVTTWWSGNNEADLLAVDWVRWNSGWRTRPVGSAPDPRRAAAHPFGLRGVYGNVSEWTESLYDPSGPPGGWRVVRGGTWNDVAVFARAALRMDVGPWFRDPGRGFRLARPLAPQPAGP